jgi:signal transduction histidine kinase
MIEKHSFFFSETHPDAPKELVLLSIVSQSFFQPFSLEDNLLVILTALTSGSGMGFNRAMLFLKDGDHLKGEMWLGPRTPQEARSIWEILATPGIGYIEIIEYNRSLVRDSEATLGRKIRNMAYSLEDEFPSVPALAARNKEILLVRNAADDPLVDPRFLETIGTPEFLCIPLLARDEVMGEIILDNAITRAPIDIRDIKLASICGLIAGNYIYSASLHRKLVEMEKMAALGEMAIFVTHQLRNPLVTIGGFTEQLINGGVDDAKRDRNLRIIRDETQRLEDVVYQIAHFLKVTFTPPVPFDIRPVLESVIDNPDIRQKAERAGIRLNARIAKCPPPVFCDPTYVGEIFRNILENAVEATPPGGKVSVLAYPKNARWFVLSVKDSGRGIADADRDKLFTPFFTTKEKGMGLGLAFVKRVMDSCGGKIEVKSRPERGTVFRLIFQCQERSSTP